MAVRLTLKRSSIPNKRPNSDILDPGELALNTNALTPGLFFEADNNEVIKVGPTAVSVKPPVISPSLGETWYNEITRSLSIGARGETALATEWQEIAAPFLGGTNGYVVFVAPEFPTSSDSVYNDGQSSPFRTLNRAAIEVAKQSIKQQNESDRTENNRFTIVVAPGITPVYNGPGFPLPSSDLSPDIPQFSVNFEGDPPDSPEVLILQQFNPQSGGMPLPRGTTILGMDLRKTQLLPTYVPTYKNPTTGAGANQSRSSVVKWTGNSLVSTVTFKDKREAVSIIDIKAGLAGEAVFVSGRPHGFGFNDKVFFSFTPGADRAPISGQSASVTSGYYYVYPLEVDTFLLSFASLDREPNYLERVQLPVAPQGGIAIANCVWDIYSHNRLSALSAATKEELDEFYIKVQLAYPLFFQGKANQAEVINPGETEIVAPVPLSKVESLISNSTSNSSPYLSNASLQSNYGLCGVEQDGSLVTGFRSAQVGSFTYISLQKDPSAYEIFTTIQDPVTKALVTDWYPLQYATWASLPSAIKPASPALVSREQQLALLNSTNLTNVRWYYESLKSEDGKSFGIPNLNVDFRHFAIRGLNNAFCQASNVWSVCAAVGFWAYKGGRLAVQNCSSNFGSMSLRSEGFAGIGNPVTKNEVLPPDSGFTFSGIRMPLRLTASDTLSSTFLALGPNILSVVQKSEDVQEILIGPGFQPINILPFSLSPGTGIYALYGSVEYQAFFVDDDISPVILNGDGSTLLRVRMQDSSFPLGTIGTNPIIREWTSPFIKRWKDPRDTTESGYALILDNTNPNHEPPVIGNVLRLNQTTPAAAKLLRPGVQLDPGASGGWGRIFQVAYSQSSIAGDSPQFNEVLLNRLASTQHYIGLSLCDSANPWLQTDDHAHGSYVTYGNRNWYAACNDYWTGIYYSIENVLPTALKLNPLEYNSPWATSYCTENLDLVSQTFQGTYGEDPQIDEYPDGSSYFRGSQPAIPNYSLEFAYNSDNGSPGFGLIKYNTNSLDVTITKNILTPRATVVTVEKVADTIPSPYKEFVVVSLTDGTGRIEYCQVINADVDTNTLTLIRGIYNTTQTADWNAGAIVTVQLPGSLVDPSQYDQDWSPSKSSMIRFLAVMGLAPEDIGNLLRPQFPSSRNISVFSISLTPKNGYAVSTGPWPLEFARASLIDAASHTFHSAGTITYSRGLPQYIESNIPTKQYYDLLFSKMWGGSGSITSMDEEGSLPTGGVFTQIETGRPFGSNSSLISDASITGDSQASGGGGGGGGGGDGITAIYTGPGILGGPIFSTGTLTLSPPVGAVIGGVTKGLGINITTEGVISVAPSGSPDIIGGVKQGTGITIATDGTISNAPSGSTSVVGGVKQGQGITIAPDGTISVSSAGIILLDNISSQFNGSKVQFNLTSSSQPVSPKLSQYALIVVGGVVQPANDAYATNGTSITFTSPPPANASFYGIVFG